MAKPAREHGDHIYCLVLCNDDRWLALNRNYEPWGVAAVAGTEWYDYDACSGTRVKLTDDQLTKLTSDGWSRSFGFGHERAWLYTTLPTTKGEHEAATMRDVVIFGLADLQDFMRANGCVGPTDISGWDEAVS